MIMATGTTADTTADITAGAAADTTAGDLQLRLISGGRDERDWVLDPRTRRTGRYGVAQARETLRRATPPRPVEHSGTNTPSVAC